MPVTGPVMRKPVSRKWKALSLASVLIALSGCNSLRPGDAEYNAGEPIPVADSDVSFVDIPPDLRKKFSPTLPLTDGERFLRQEGTRLAVPENHELGYLYRVTINLMRNRPLDADPFVDDPRAGYYRLRRLQGIASNEARYNLLLDDMRRANIRAKTYWIVAADVLSIERDRLKLLTRQTSEGALDLNNLKLMLRSIENRNLVAEAIIEMAYQYQAYSYAVDRLRVEIPSQESFMGGMRELANLSEQISNMRAEIDLVDEELHWLVTVYQRIYGHSGDLGGGIIQLPVIKPARQGTGPRKLISTN